MTPEDISELDALLDEARRVAPLGATASARLHAAIADFRARRWRILVSGLCSVGKSSFVCALWGDSELLPTAVRDCTQTNTLIRVPEAGEDDRRILLSHLTRERALDFATRSLAYYRLHAFLAERLGPLVRLDEGLPEQRLRAVIARVRALFQERADLLVLYEHLTDEADQLQQFLDFLDSPHFRPGEIVPARWEDRREHLMGLRRPDGRTLDTGKLLALRHIELARESGAWNGSAEGASSPPHLVDSPWIPTYHNARRTDLILEQAREADVLVIVALPDKFELEDWVMKIFRERHELVRRTLIVFNQIDTLDIPQLFARGGFAQQFEENRDKFTRIGFDADNLLMSCARLPFLEKGPQDAYVAERAQKLRRVLERVASAAQGRPESPFKSRLLAACDPADAGIQTVRRRLLSLYAGPVLRHRALEALKMLELLDPLRARAEALRVRIM